MPRKEVFNKEEVISKSIQLFWLKGYNGSSMEDLTIATGLNRSSIYNSFGSKMKLYKIALKHYQKETRLIYQKGMMQAANPREAIQLIFESYIAKIIQDRECKGCFFINSKAEMSSKDASLREWQLHTEEQNTLFFETLVIEGQERGLINTRHTANQYANYLYNALQGLRVTGILVQDKGILQPLVYTTLRLLM